MYRNSFSGEIKMKIFRGRSISRGLARGKALVSKEAISFYGGVDPTTGIIVEKGHILEGKCIAGKILIFPRGKGSTVGSYIIYRLTRMGLGPKAIVNMDAEPIVAIGAIISNIPMIDKIDESIFEIVSDESILEVDGDNGILHIL